MTESAISDEADVLYRRLGGLEPWASVPVADVAPQPPDPVLARGALLAAAHESAALDGMHAGDRRMAISLLRGASSLSAVDPGRRDHVRANYRALVLAAAATDEDLASETWLRRVHAVACRPQLTHPVRTEAGVQDHVLATGDYKHHANHARSASDAWIAHAPVALLQEEMARYVELAGSAAFAPLHPFARAAFALHALTHVAPFADGNGRVARAVASAHLLRAMSLPLLVFADERAAYEAAVATADVGALVAFVGDHVRALLDLVSDGSDPGARERWRRRADAGDILASLLPERVEHALARHRQRQDLGWLSSLAGAVVAAAAPLAVRVPPTAVEETVTVDAHPVSDEDVLVLRAAEAQLRLDVRPDEVLPEVSHALSSRLDPWLDRVVSCLALRVAADVE